MINYMDNDKIKNELPSKWQEPYSWIMNNFDFIYRICRVLDFTESERKILWQRATETEDIELLLLLEVECIINFKTNSQE